MSALPADSNHGHQRTFWRGCRCVACRAAFSKYQMETRRSRAARGPAFVSAAPSRRHLRRFANLHAVADVLGCDASWLWRIRAGHQKTVRPESERRILSANYDLVVKRRPMVMSDGVRVPAVKVKKLVRKLQDEGFTLKQIASGAGIAKAILIPRKRNVFASTEMKIEKFYRKVMAA
jgi:hypothetical protein